MPFKKEKVLSEVGIEDIIERKKLRFANKQIGEEIRLWLSEIKNDSVKIDYLFLSECPMPKLRDVLGFIYQSLLPEGKKSQSGPYYTPFNIVDEIVGEYVKKIQKYNHIHGIINIAGVGLCADPIQNNTISGIIQWFKTRGGGIFTGLYHN